MKVFKASISILVLAIMLFVSSAQSDAAMKLDIQSSTSESKMQTVELAVSESETLLLNEKPLHIDFLTAVLMDMQITGDVNVELQIAPNAPMGIVGDTKRILNDLGIEAGQLTISNN